MLQRMTMTEIANRTLSRRTHNSHCQLGLRALNLDSLPILSQMAAYIKLLAAFAPGQHKNETLCGGKCGSGGCGTTR